MRWTLDDQYSVMPWEQIDQVVFDVGNVLLGFQPEALLREILPDLPEDVHDRLYARLFVSPYWTMMDRGTASVDEVVEAMSAGYPNLRPLIQRFMNEWNARLPVLPEGVEALQTCKAHGKRCYVLSNYADEPFADSCRRHPEIFGQFDGMIVSARVKLAKPDAAIYRLLIDTFSLEPARTLFIDDTARNAEAALNCGMQAVHYARPGQLAAFMR